MTLWIFWTFHIVRSWGKMKFLEKIHKSQNSCPPPRIGAKSFSRIYFAMFCRLAPVWLNFFLFFFFVLKKISSKNHDFSCWKFWNPKFQNFQCRNQKIFDFPIFSQKHPRIPKKHSWVQERKLFMFWGLNVAISESTRIRLIWKITKSSKNFNTMFRDLAAHSTLRASSYDLFLHKLSISIASFLF